MATSRSSHYAVPDGWNFSRFFSNRITVETEQGLVSRMLIDLREQLMVVLPVFGRHMGYDGKAINCHSTGQVDSKSGHCSDPDADWEPHETAGINAKTGNSCKKFNIHAQRTWNCTSPLEGGQAGQLTKPPLIFCACILKSKLNDTGNAMSHGTASRIEIAVIPNS